MMKKRLSLIILTIALLMFVFACSRGNDAAILHNSNWADASQHGQDGQGNLSSCTNCHGSDLLGGSTGTECYTCHHDQSTWLSSMHREFGSFTLEGCKSCHGSDLLGGTTGVACNTCHALPTGDGGVSPHGDNWVDEDEHGAAGQDNLDSCKSCHGSDLLGGTTGVACNTCHAIPGGDNDGDDD